MGRTMQRKLEARSRSAARLLGQRKLTDLPGLRRISDIDDTIDFSRHTRRAGRRVNEIAAVVKIAMRAGAAGLEMADPARFGRLANVEDEKAFGKGLAVNAAPTRRNAFQRRNHFSFGDLDLDGPSIFRAWNISDELRRRWIRDVENAPAAMPEMREIEIPAAVHLLHRELERRLAIEIVIANQVDVVSEVR